MKWTQYSDIQKDLLKKWKKGKLLTNDLIATEEYPIKLKLKGPTRDELQKNYIEVSNWIKHLNKHKASKNGYGYKLVQKEVNYQNIGKNIIPSHIIVESIHDLQRIIDIKDEITIFETNCKLLLNYSERLKPWIVKYPFKVIEKIGDDGERFIKVLDWFAKNDYNGLYIRQFNIDGVDTKFIESNKPLLSELLDITLQPDKINLSEKRFEDRFGIRNKPNMIRFRLLDSGLETFSDMTVPITEFEIWNPQVETFFLVENEINYLTFPYVANSCVIFAKGYNAYILQNTKWLVNKNLYYWGDIDTHGFNILSQVRSFLPTIKSLLMTEEVLLMHRDQWVIEDKQNVSDIKNLTPAEKELTTRLQTDYFGTKVRLEQERITYDVVQTAITNRDK